MNGKRVYAKEVEQITMSVKLPLARVNFLRRIANGRGYEVSVSDLVRESLEWASQWRKRSHEPTHPSVRKV